MKRRFFRVLKAILVVCFKMVCFVCVLFFIVNVVLPMLLRAKYEVVQFRDRGKFHIMAVYVEEDKLTDNDVIISDGYGRIAYCDDNYIYIETNSKVLGFDKVLNADLFSSPDIIYYKISITDLDLIMFFQPLYIMLEKREVSKVSALRNVLIVVEKVNDMDVCSGIENNVVDENSYIKVEYDRLSHFLSDF